MNLSNHIAKKLLYEDAFVRQVVAKTFEGKDVADSKVLSLENLLSPRNNKTYWITDTVLGLLGLLRVKREEIPAFGQQFDWRVFHEVPNCKKTFILSDNRLIRIGVSENVMYICYLTYSIINKELGAGMSNWNLFWVDRHQGIKHLDQDSREIEEFVYKLLCFIFLSDITEEIVAPGGRHGTRKSGKIINSLNTPVTIINTKWNVTQLSTEKSNVTGYFNLYWTGAGRTKPRVRWVYPHTRKGRTKKAPKESRI